MQRPSLKELVVNLLIVLYFYYMVFKMSVTTSNQSFPSETKCAVRTSTKFRVSSNWYGVRTASL